MPRMGSVGAAVAAVLICIVPRPARAGVVNPNISVLGQPFLRWTNDPADPSAKRVTLNQGEVEAVFDAYLNPYATGMFVLSVADHGIDVEEGYFTLLRGLPGGLVLKGGKYRVNFGKFNVMHPHAVPFMDRPRVLAAYLPGEESLNETGVSLSERIPVPGTFSLTVSGDWLQGDSYRIARHPSLAPDDPLSLDPEGDDRADEARPAFVGHLSGFGSIGDRSGYELTLSATGGTNNVAAGTLTKVYDAGGKLKLWTAPNSYLLVQGEVLKLDREDAGWDEARSTYTSTSVEPLGGYAYADYNFNPRWDAGALYEGFEEPTTDKTSDQSVGAFVGLSLLEETTVFRLDVTHFMPGTPPGASESPDAVDTVNLRVIFSMGPHKAHQF
ncbi:MAG: hypothetical protein U0167_17060 [bacterium]